MGDIFKFYVEADVDIVKSESSGGRRIIQGYASTPSVDRQGESLVQKGLDISDFVKHGWLNYDHDNTIILGYPTENTRIDERGLWVEGELFKGVPMADRIWELAVALKKSNAPRRLGFSVEGKILERRGNQIIRAKIYNCALTPNPVNPEATWEAVVKSFRPDEDGNIVKALEVGYPTSPENQVNGGAFAKEDLESNLKVLAENLENRDFWNRIKTHLANGGKVTTNEMVVYLQLSKGLSRSQALDIINRFKY